MELEVVENISQADFVGEYIAKNKPVVVSGIPFDETKWTPGALKGSIGELTTQVYDTLFDLENIMSLSEYVDEYFGTEGPYQPDVPYVRWYNQLKDVDFVWGDEAFEELSKNWQKPACLPDTDLVVPLAKNGSAVNPVTDPFPYRGILVAARGARTRLHRDPFCTDAVVAQFHGTKEAVLYHPERIAELTANADGTSFGGFIDVREDDVSKVSVEPDYQGLVKPGQMIYIPHGWLHDVLVVEDSVSVTWNFIHQAGSNEFLQYLQDKPEDDSEFEVLQYFFALAGHDEMTAQEMMAKAA